MGARCEREGCRGACPTPLTLCTSASLNTRPPPPPPPSPLSLPCLPLPACSAVEVWHLQRVLAKKRDPLTHALFLDVVAPGDDDPLPLDRFW